MGADPRRAERRHGLSPQQAPAGLPMRDSEVNSPSTGSPLPWDLISNKIQVNRGTGTHQKGVFLIIIIIIYIYTHIYISFQAFTECLRATYDYLKS